MSSSWGGYELWGNSSMEVRDFSSVSPEKAVIWQLLAGHQAGQPAGI
jgi:hypothetical protein